MLPYRFGDIVRFGNIVRFGDIVFAKRTRFASGRQAFVLLTVIVLAGEFAVAQDAAAQENSLPSDSEVSVTLADGRELRGEFVRMDESGIAIDLASDVKTYPIESISKVVFGTTVQTSPPTRIELTGGSVLSVSSIKLDDEILRIVPSRQSALQIPVKRLRWVRFRPAATATDPVWLGWLEEGRRGDRLVVRRDEKSLDSIDGSVLSISSQSVGFDLNGNVIEAPLGKLEGVIVSNSAPPPTTPELRVTDTSGSVWAVQSARISEESSTLTIDLGDSISHSIPLSQLVRFDFAGGILPLAQAEIAAAEFGGLPMGIDGDAKAAKSNSTDMQLINEWFAPTANEGVITIQSPGKITLRIPPEYQTLIVAARRSPEVNRFAKVSVEVLLDDEVRWSGTLENRDSLGLQLPLDGARQLTLRASLPDAAVIGQTIGGSVEWFGGRLLK